MSSASDVSEASPRTQRSVRLERFGIAFYWCGWVTILGGIVGGALIGTTTRTKYHVNPAYPASLIGSQDYAFIPYGIAFGVGALVWGIMLFAAAEVLQMFADWDD